jgi:hypothetical protein
MLTNGHSEVPWGRPMIQHSLGLRHLTKKDALQLATAMLEQNQVDPWAGGHKLRKLGIKRNEGHREGVTRQ